MKALVGLLVLAAGILVPSFAEGQCWSCDQKTKDGHVIHIWPEDGDWLCENPADHEVNNCQEKGEEPDDVELEGPCPTGGCGASFALHVGELLESIELTQRAPPVMIKTFLAAYPASLALRESGTLLQIIDCDNAVVAHVRLSDAS